jgi:cyclic pyranopterin phosphate synthase
MPEEEYVWLPRADVLSFEELARLVDVFTRLGVDKVRLTGGEPLLRRGLERLVAALAARPAIGDLALTTNGALLAPQAEALHRAGLHRVTVSLDTLQPDRFRALTRVDQLDQVLEGIREARRVFGRLKLDTVVIRGVNDDEIAALVAFGRTWQAEPRFIEYMDVGGATRWSPATVVSRREILAALEAASGPLTPVAKHDWAPADTFTLADGTVVGVISSTTEPFCSTCDRGRLTADGIFLPCLYATAGLDLRTPLRDGSSDDSIAERIATYWQRRNDRGAEDRRRAGDRKPFIPLGELRRNAHLEMHTRGG